MDKNLQEEMIEAIDGFKRITKEAEEILNKVMDMGVYSITNLNGIKLVSWSDGSWEDISAMLEAHYKGDIDITEYWKTGDTKEVKLNNGDILYLTLIGSNHDDLVKNINEATKAAFTVQSKILLERGKYMFNKCNSVAYSSWHESDMRIFLNTDFNNLLPKELQSLIKTVKKETYCYALKSEFSYLYRNSVISEEKIFLLSETEVRGKQLLDAYEYGNGSDGKHYEYYTSNGKRVKCRLKMDDSFNYWWLRSSLVDKHGFSYFRYVNNRGAIETYRSDGIIGVAPAFCI